MEVSADLERRLSGIVSVRNMKFAVEERENQQDFIRRHIPWLKNLANDLLMLLLLMQGCPGLTGVVDRRQRMAQVSTCSSALDKHSLALGFRYRLPGP